MPYSFLTSSKPFGKCCWIFLFLFSTMQFALGQEADRYDIVLNGGRVIDIETNLDAILNVGITNGKIETITSDPIQGKETIDATGLVVSAGFIDLHVHGVSNTEQEFQIYDGVTTALELEAGLPFLKEWYAARSSRALINYGASVNWAILRAEALGIYSKELAQLKESMSNGSGLDVLKMIRPFGRSLYQGLSKSETESLISSMRESLHEGGLGIGLPVGYAPGASREEIFRIHQFAGEVQAPVFNHVREGGTLAIQQAISDALITQAPLHIVHVNSIALNEIELVIEMVQTAQAKGFDVSTEIYPYTAASTEINSAIFREGWQERLGMDYGDLQWVATGERLTEATFATYKETGGTVIMHMMKPEWIKAGIATKGTIIASDGMAYSKLAHPRTAGTFSRVLGKYVREENILSLSEAIKKMTLLPALRLEDIAPVMQQKGRMQEGRDADITIFDPKTIIDKATFENGLEFSQGVHYVLVNGKIVLQNGKLLENVFAGQPVYGRYKK